MVKEKVFASLKRTPPGKSKMNKEENKEEIEIIPVKKYNLVEQDNINLTDDDQANRPTLNRKDLEEDHHNREAPLFQSWGKDQKSETMVLQEETGNYGKELCKLGEENQKKVLNKYKTEKRGLGFQILKDHQNRKTPKKSRMYHSRSKNHQNPGMIYSSFNIKTHKRSFFKSFKIILNSASSKINI